MEKKILTAITIVFFIVMLAFTFISRKTAVELLPQVEAVYAEDGITFPATAVYTDQWGNSFVYAIMEKYEKNGERKLHAMGPRTHLICRI